MAKLKAKARQDSDVSRVSESGTPYARATRDGALINLDWKSSLIMEGRGFYARVGTLTTPVNVAGSANVIDVDRPDWVVGIPSGTSILPYEVDMQMKPVSATADDNEIDILLAVDQDKMNASSSGTATAGVIYNLNTLHSRASSCYFNYTYSATMTDPVLDLELMHVTKIFELHSSIGEIWMEFALHYEPKTVPIINGPAMLIGYAGGTKGAAMFHQIKWIELPTSLVRES